MLHLVKLGECKVMSLGHIHIKIKYFSTETLCTHGPQVISVEKYDNQPEMTQQEATKACYITLHYITLTFFKVA